MTDNEIIKALEVCNESFEMGLCAKCPYSAIPKSGCTHDMINDAIALITRQKAEIERLETENKNLLKRLCKKAQTASKAVKKLIRAEAIKEVAEALEAEWESSKKYIRENVYEDSITERAYNKGLLHALNVVKEMEEQNV